MVEWIEGFFDGARFYDFPSFEVALFSMLLAFLLSATVAMTYRFTFRGEDFPNHFFQGMVLSSTVSAMIMMAVGNNLAVGFGIIGAVAIIRFRTNIQNPRNIIFMFESLSIGIATGVYGYSIAIAGTAIFCVIAVVLHFSHFGVKRLKYELNLYYEQDPGNIEALLNPYCDSIHFVRQRRNREGLLRREYLLTLREKAGYVKLFEALLASESFIEVRLDEAPDQVML
jgi:uncharacterized membrane protein YhiD involved in acid resistance